MTCMGFGVARMCAVVGVSCGCGTAYLVPHSSARYGRVNFILRLRVKLLKEVERLQHSLGVPGDVAYTCETAGHFFLYQVVSRWEEFMSRVKPLANEVRYLCFMYTC